MKRYVLNKKFLTIVRNKTLLSNRNSIVLKILCNPYFLEQLSTIQQRAEIINVYGETTIKSASKIEQRKVARKMREERIQGCYELRSNAIFPIRRGSFRNEIKESSRVQLIPKFSPSLRFIYYYQIVQSFVANPPKKEEQSPREDNARHTT